MKLFHKIFLCFVILFSITFQAAGFLLIHFAYQNALEQEKNYAVQEFQYNKYILQSLIYSGQELLDEGGVLGEGGRGLEDKTQNFTTAFAVYGEKGDCLFSNLSVLPEFAFSGAGESATFFQIYQTGGESYIFVYGSLRDNGRDIYLVTETDISRTMNRQQEMNHFFQKIFLVILGIAFSVIFLLSSFLTKNIGKVSRGAKRIAEGNYSERIPVSGRDEISDLAADFNQMAEKVEEKVQELRDTARQKEDFTANFAHELKTPLTSVIGYADLLYQKELPREQVKSAAEYILNEGMRLEALSLKLMDLFVMDKQNFCLESVGIREVFENLMGDIELLCHKGGVNCHMDIGDFNLDIDYDLFKTLIMNLVDNAIKAECRDIWISAGNYRVSVGDNGKGIPPRELSRITEAFYMVDKSRSRKQHGAGLGLALATKIAEIHGAKLELHSDGCSGTEAVIIFQVQRAEFEEGNRA